MSETAVPIEQVERIGFLCIQHYPTRICSGCTSACCEPVFAYPAQRETVPDPREGKTVVDGVGEPHPFDADHCGPGCQPTDA